MKTITAAELVEILRKHKKWLNYEPGGERADLRCANLYGADLSSANLYGANLSSVNLYGADLRCADLRCANLYGADLRCANLYGADLYGADLSSVNLYGADLRCANLRCANLCGADLYGADLSSVNLYGADLSSANLYGADLRGADLSSVNLYGANLRGAKNINLPIACPEKGSFVAFKKVNGNYIVELEIPADAARCSATSRKCRCSYAKVLSITNIDGTPADVDVVYSKHDYTFAYRVGATVIPDSFDPDRWHECAPGIHFFITRQEAVDY